MNFDIAISIQVPTFYEDLVLRLLSSQFPKWANLPVTIVGPGGWDNPPPQLFFLMPSSALFLLTDFMIFASVEYSTKDLQDQSIAAGTLRSTRRGHPAARGKQDLFSRSG